MAKLKSPVFAGIILIALWGLELWGATLIGGFPMDTPVIIGLVAVMVLTLILFILWNNKKS